ncbi:hypothetical protein DFH06DRAFT_1149847 [Mycena polygramma]|nr:hypothetical protein DFH06DRAFT_1149847 [Mycena polygramma]
MLAMASAPFPIAASLGFTDRRRTVLRPQIDQQISHWLWAHLTPPDPSHVLPYDYDGHVLSDPKINTGKTPNERFLGQFFQPLAALISARHEVAAMPRTPSSRSTASSHSPGSSSTRRRRRTRFGSPVTPESPLANVWRTTRPLSDIVSPIRAVPSSVLDRLVSNTAGPSRTTVTAAVNSDSNPTQPSTSAIALLNFEYSPEASHSSVTSTAANTSQGISVYPVFIFNPEHAPDISVRSPAVDAHDQPIISISSGSSNGTSGIGIAVPSPAVYARDGSIISISSGSASDIGELSYPDEADDQPVVMDMLSPVRLFVWVKDNEPGHRLTVYPQYREGATSWLMLSDYKYTLAKLGFDVEERAEMFLPYTKVWICYPFNLAVPITQANTLVFIRTAGISTESPDDALDTLF